MAHWKEGSWAEGSWAPGFWERLRVKPNKNRDKDEKPAGVPAEPADESPTK